MKFKMSLIALAVTFASPLAFGDAAALYSTNCKGCHAADGSGNTTMGKKSKAKDYTDAKVQASFTDAEAQKAILEGQGKMKGYKDKVSEAEAAEIVKHIRSFKK